MKEDKGNEMVVINSTDYEANMMEHFITTRCYKKLSKDPRERTIRDVTKIIKNSSLDEGIKKKLIPKNPITPRIYRLPKIHKKWSTIETNCEHYWVTNL